MVDFQDFEDTHSHDIAPSNLNWLSTATRRLTPGTRLDACSLSPNGCGPTRSPTDQSIKIPPCGEHRAGWEERMSTQGKKFYINHNDKTTHWARPPAPAPGSVSGKGSYQAGSPSSPNYTTPFATSDGSRPLSMANSTGGSEEHIETATRSSGGGSHVSVGGEEATAAFKERVAEETADGDDDEVAEHDGDGADEPVTDTTRAPYASVRTKSVTPPALPSRQAAEVEDDKTADASSGQVKRGALSVLSSGMFGATVNRTGSGGVGGDGSSWNGSSASGSRGVTPDYASNAVIQVSAWASSGRDDADELPPGELLTRKNSRPIFRRLDFDLALVQ